MKYVFRVEVVSSEILTVTQSSCVSSTLQKTTTTVSASKHNPQLQSSINNGAGANGQVTQNIITLSYELCSIYT